MSVTKAYIVVSGISAAPHEDNIRYFNVIIAGPQSSPFEGIAHDKHLHVYFLLFILL